MCCRAVITAQHRIYRVQIVIHAHVITWHIQGVSVGTITHRVPIDASGGRWADKSPLANLSDIQVLIGDAFLVFDVDANDDVLVAGFLGPKELTGRGAQGPDYPGLTWHPSDQLATL